MQGLTPPLLNRRTLLALLLAGSAPGTARAQSALRFSHAFGDISLPAPAQRVVSLGYTSHDTLLALGVVPVALRFWYGGSESGVWPWAEPLLGDARPEVLRGEVSMERIAALSPDLIVGIGSGITHAEYEVLSLIAPVLMQPAAYDVFSTPWDVLTELLGRATGREAAALIAATAARFAGARDRHPAWAGKTAVAAYFWAGVAGAYLPGDARAEFLTLLGLAPPPGLKPFLGHSFYQDLSPEDLSPLEADLLIWVSAFDSDPDLAALPMRKTLAVHRAGGEVFAGSLTAAAMAHASVLSMPYALDRLEAELAAALDGDPATVVPSAAETGLAP